MLNFVKLGLVKADESFKIVQLIKMALRISNVKMIHYTRTFTTIVQSQHSDGISFNFIALNIL